jgi:hypothetical protein
LPSVPRSLFLMWMMPSASTQMMPSVMTLQG